MDDTTWNLAISMRHCDDADDFAAMLAVLAKRVRRRPWLRAAALQAAGIQDIDWRWPSTHIIGRDATSGW